MNTMTNATITQNNVTVSENVNKEEKDCNQTEIIGTITPNPDLILIQAQNINSTDKNNTNSTESMTDNQQEKQSTEKSVTINNNEEIQTSDKKLPANKNEESQTSNEDVAATSRQENQTKVNDVIDTNTVLKYVYKKGDNINVDKKNNGHLKNSLKRRKRSPDDPLSPLPSKFQNPALIVNYETSHAPTALSNWAPPLSSQSNIKLGDIADFKFETQHNNEGNRNIRHKDSSINKDSSEVEHLNESNKERTDKYKENNDRENSSQEIYDESTEKGYGDKKLIFSKDNRGNGNEKTSKKNPINSSADENSKEDSERYKDKNLDVKGSESREITDSRGKDDDEDFFGSGRYSYRAKPYEFKSLGSPSKNKDHQRDNHQKYKEDSKDGHGSRYNPRSRESYEEEEPKRNKDSYRRGNHEASKENSREDHSTKYTPNTKSRESYEEVDEPKRSKDSYRQNKHKEEDEPKRSKESYRQNKYDQEDKPKRSKDNYQQNNYEEEDEPKQSKDNYRQNKYEEDEPKRSKDSYRQNKYEEDEPKRSKDSYRQNNHEDEDEPKRNKDSYRRRNHEASSENSREDHNGKYNPNTRSSESYEEVDEPKRNKDNYRSGEQVSSKQDSREGPNGSYNQNTKSRGSYEDDDVPQRNKGHYRNDKPRYSEEDDRENNNEKYSARPYKSYSDNPSHNSDSKDDYRKESVEISDERSDERNKDKYNNEGPKYNRQSNENQAYSNENSNESREKDTSLPPAKANFKSDLTNTAGNKSLPIQDIDLGDFSYERVQLNNNGKVVPINDNHGNGNPNSDIELLPNKQMKPDTKNLDVLQLVTNIHTPSKENLIHINDGEVKPVVEINSENDDDSSNKSNSESLETILGATETQQSDKIVVNEQPQNGDVKQQFERIPLNYNHDQTSQQKESQVNEGPKEATVSKVEASPALGDAPKEENEAEPEVIGIDFNPEDYTQIRLPEINLPDDILAFTKAHSPFYRENDDRELKRSRYHNDENDRDEPRNQKSKKSDDDEDIKDDDSGPNYYGYYGDNIARNQNYQQKNDEEEEGDEGDREGETEANDGNEDLYEKFVRERFGKRGTFGQRSEKIQERPLNPHLTKNIKNILQKTAAIDEQVKKSGDPNAGYAWTLEYGENL